ncbi:hypothetical protein SmJEL517_g04197 [Synchytrium microbalum]|uniref:ADF-H domain-containing protein n=1 Tax=Synchytrium microbalum TaxID=1806994 RepID=A0A507BT12_9FUNG|nr:uncharacterized protein SmJEL517_g04197 [Synchytrium microbalum]TPX32720.1 hypothetical protein SmJEL517_g04197 [Synchytrium microbalum]
MSSISVKLDNEAAIVGAIKNVRDDANPAQWCIIGHLNDDVNTVTLQATGNEGVDELKSKFASNQVQYALIRVTTTVDLSKVVRFVYIYNLGADVSFVKRGRMGIVKGSVSKLFEPYHVDFEINEAREISENIVIEKVNQAAGVANNVREKNFVVGKQERGFTGRSAHVSPTKPTAEGASLSPGNDQQQRTSTSVSPTARTSTISKSANSSSATSPTKPQAATQSATLQIAPELVDAIRAVRDDKVECRWVVASYKDGDIAKPVSLTAKAAQGEGVDVLKTHFKPDAISYAYVKVIDVIEGIATIKFAFITWIGPEVSVMKKARIGVHQGAIKEYFNPFHVEIVSSELREISDNSINNKVSSFSGSKSFVR